MIALVNVALYFQRRYFREAASADETVAFSGAKS
jgi:hypothetical protein